MIRRAVAADAAALLALERSVAEAAHWSDAEYAQILQDDDGAALRRWIFVVVEEEALLGFIVVKLLRAGDVIEAEIENLAVAAGARRRGLGAALCGAAVDGLSEAGARVVELEVRAGNGAAIGLYTGLGFEQTGVRVGYYANPKEDAVLLRFRVQDQQKSAG